MTRRLALPFFVALAVWGTGNATKIDGVPRPGAPIDGRRPASLGASFVFGALA